MGRAGDGATAALVVNEHLQELLDLINYEIE